MAGYIPGMPYMCCCGCGAHPGGLQYPPPPFIANFSLYLLLVTFTPTLCKTPKSANTILCIPLPFPPSATIAHPELILVLSFSLSAKLSYGRSSVWEPSLWLLQGRLREQSLCWCRHSREDLLQQLRKYRVRNRPAPTRRRREKKKGFEGGFGSDE